MSDTARKKFRMQVEPSDRQLWAIGMVVVQWASLEQTVALLADCFTDKDDPNDPQRKSYEALRGFVRRMDALEDLVKINMRAPWKGRMLDITTEIRNLADLRDKVVHGIWGRKNNANDKDPDPAGPFNWIKPGHPYSWNTTYGDLLKLAQRIDAANGAIFDFIIAANGPVTQDVLWSQAIKKTFV